MYYFFSFFTQNRFSAAGLMSRALAYFLYCLWTNSNALLKKNHQKILKIPDFRKFRPKKNPRNLRFFENLEISHRISIGNFRNFAITISIGILASMLTAILGTHGIYSSLESKINKSKNPAFWFGISKKRFEHAS